MRHSPTRRVLPVLAAGALLFAACGSDDSSDDTAAPADTEASADEATADTEAPAGDCSARAVITS